MMSTSTTRQPLAPAGAATRRSAHEVAAANVLRDGIYHASIANAKEQVAKELNATTQNKRRVRKCKVTPEQARRLLDALSPLDIPHTRRDPPDSEPPSVVVAAPTPTPPPSAAGSSPLCDGGSSGGDSQASEARTERASSRATMAPSVRSCVSTWGAAAVAEASKPRLAASTPPPAAAVRPSQIPAPRPRHWHPPAASAAFAGVSPPALPKPPSPRASTVRAKETWKATVAHTWTPKGTPPASALADASPTGGASATAAPTRARDATEPQAQPAASEPSALDDAAEPQTEPAAFEPAALVAPSQAVVPEADECSNVVPEASGSCCSTIRTATGPAEPTTAEAAVALPSADREAGASDAAAAAATAAELPSRLPAPPTPSAVPAHPPVVAATLTKHGMPWRGQYERILAVTAGRVATFEPMSGELTNEWPTPRDMPRAVHRPAAGTLELFVAPWPGAPGWLAQPLTFSAAPDILERAVEALAQQAKVGVERLA